jgi:hypothetical protein
VRQLGLSTDHVRCLAPIARSRVSTLVSDAAVVPNLAADAILISYQLILIAAAVVAARTCAGNRWGTK